MPQIAQQDYLRIEIDGLPEEITDADKARIRELHDRGILMDALLIIQRQECRVVTDNIYVNDEIVIVFNGALTVIDVS